MKKLILAGAMAIAAGFSAMAEPLKYDLDAPHSQIIFSWNHFGITKTSAMFSGFGGEIVFDKEKPATSSVSVTIPVASVFTGWAKRDETFQSEEFFNATSFPDITFKSTSINVTGLNTADITGDLSLKGKSIPVVLDAMLTGEGMNPVYKKKIIGFTATASLLRGDFGLERLIPVMGNKIDIQISVEGVLAD